MTYGTHAVPCIYTLVYWTYRSPGHSVDPIRRDLTDVKVEGILLAIERLRVLDREVPAQVISCFLYIASHNHCHKEAIEEDLGFTTASSSRNIDWLTDKHRLNKPGLGLVIKERDPDNKRRIICTLSSKGRDLIIDLMSDLYD